MIDVGIVKRSECDVVFVEQSCANDAEERIEDSLVKAVVYGNHCI